MLRGTLNGRITIGFYEICGLNVSTPRFENPAVLPRVRPNKMVDMDVLDRNLPLIRLNQGSCDKAVSTNHRVRAREILVVAGAALVPVEAPFRQAPVHDRERFQIAGRRLMDDPRDGLAGRQPR